MTAKVPCPHHCGRRLDAHFDTDGNGGTVQRVAPCDCPEARWTRGECVDCGVAVPRSPNLRGARRGKKRCPKHEQAAKRRAWRKYARKAYAENPEPFRERQREYRQQPHVRTRQRRYAREWHRAAARVRQQGRERRARERAERDARILRLHAAGWLNTEIAREVGLSDCRVGQILKRDQCGRERERSAA